MTDSLFYGDNLNILRHMADGSVDLIYLDPPYNSKRGLQLQLRQRCPVQSLQGHLDLGRAGRHPHQGDHQGQPDPRCVPAQPW